MERDRRDVAFRVSRMSSPAIETVHLTRTYKLRRKRGARSDIPAPAELTALAGVSLEVRPGELFGLLGPNGAGKTTLIKILTTLLTPSAGIARVDGLDVVKEAHAIRPRINMVSGGESSGYGLLTVRENLWLFTQLYGVPGKVARRRIDAMLEVVGLADRADTKISQLSTGLRQKMNFCRGFVTDPTILFLDEPTLGLDVNAARAIRAFVKRWLAEKAGRTLLLTTHYMTEADELCDRIAIIDGGKVLACDSPAALKRLVQRYSTFEIKIVAHGVTGGGLRAGLAGLPGVHSCAVEATPEALVVKVALEQEAAVGAVVQALAAGGGHLLSLRNLEPTLEDVFIELVGRGLTEEGDRS
jgi:ABC-2 type transport system ATP-binding protein